MEILKEPFFSAKLLRLIEILSNFRLTKLYCLNHSFNAYFHIAHVLLIFGYETNIFGQILIACSNFRLQKNMKCIIFVNRIVIARSLSYILQKLKLLRQWRSDFLVGVHAGLKSMSRKTMNIIVDRFRSGEVLLLDFSLIFKYVIVRTEKPVEFYMLVLVQ